MYVILALLLIVVGLVMLIRPAAVYALTESWKSNTAGEPSRLFCISTRIGGGLCLLVGIVGAIVLLLT